MDIEEATRHLGVSTKMLLPFSWPKAGGKACMVKDGPTRPRLDFSLEDLEKARWGFQF